MTQHHWTEEDTEQLKALWAKGLSAAEIAPRINGGTTRNAIIGKIHRLHIPPRPLDNLTPRQRVTTRTQDLPSKPRLPETTEQKARHNARRRELRAARRLGITLASLTGKMSPLKPRLWKARHASPVPAPAYAGEPVSILEVTGCKFAVKSEGREHRFCNAPTPENSSWCTFHETIVWNP